MWNKISVKWYGAQFDLKDAIIRLEDGTTPDPLYTELTISEGSLSYTEHKDREYVLDRGRLYTVKNADEAPIDVSITAVWEKISGLVLDAGGNAIPAFEDCLKQKNAAASWKTTDTDPCAPYCVNLVIELLPPCGGAGAQRITLPYFRYDSLAHDGGAATIAIEGRCNAAEAIVEEMESELISVDFTPASLAQGGTLSVTWEQSFIPGEMFIDLVPTTGDPIRVGTATARLEKWSGRISAAKVAAGSYKVRCTAAQLPDQVVEAIGSLTVTA